MASDGAAFATAAISRDRDQFLRELLRELSGVLQESVGLPEAEGFISKVGDRLAQGMNAEYRRIAGVENLDRATVADALVDLKRRIEGGFSVEEIDDEKIVLVNTKCPFGRYVDGRKSLCMLTSNIFGRIAADNLGYARVALKETIADGHSGCRVIVYFSDGSDGREYFG